ncbi:hypothetical protein COOONC_15303 [Cooperia oncophora]
MRNLTIDMSEWGVWERNASFVSHFEEAVELYLSSQLCRAFLITAATSTFGWWLAFFVPNQNDVFYIFDNRTQNGKTPEKEHFLNSWTPL